MWNWVQKAHELQTKGVPFVLATVTGRKGSAPRELGAKMIILDGGEFYGTVGGGKLEQFVLEDGQKFLNEALTERLPYPLCFRTGQCCGGAVDVFFEVVGLRPQLYIFGAGHVGQAVAQVMTGTPFAVHLVDQREEWVHHPALPPEAAKHEKHWRSFCDEALWDGQRVYAVVMTHEHATDEEIVAYLCKKQLRYLGLIGSQTKWARFEGRLKQRGLGEAEIGRVKCPIGLYVAGKAPKEIAVSFAAEILSLYHEKL